MGGELGPCGYGSSHVGHNLIRTESKCTVYNMAQHIPNFKGAVYFEGDSNYDEHRYQYAYSSHKGDGNMNPAAILYATSTKDIKAALAYARENGVAMSVRTGGHQYSGASSTAAPNIQLDLREFRPNEITIFDDDSKVTPTARLSVSLKLSDLNAMLGKRGLFVPHGQCSNVHVGGHLHTGGYGQLGRSFGLFGDHVESLEVILPDGSDRVLRRGEPDDKELMFSILGGSPGNFCVVHHVTIRLHRDSDHPLSRGLKMVFFYTRPVLENLLNIVADIANDADYPGDFDYCVTLISSSLTGAKGGIDEHMQVKHPKEYGENKQGVFPAGILVYAQWANTQGPRQPLDNRLFEAIRGVHGLRLAVGVDEDSPTPMSQLTAQWVYMNIREFELPYEKRTYMSGPRSMGFDKDWAATTARRIDMIQGDLFNWCKLSIQIQPFGGNQSKYETLPNDYSSYSWRDSTICCVMDCFYSGEDAKATAIKWQEGNDKIVRDGMFGVDRRVLWGSYGNLPLYDDSIWPTYYKPAVYQQHCDTKRAIDPTGVLTPNTFCVLPRPPPDPSAGGLLTALATAPPCPDEDDDACMLSASSLVETHVPSATTLPRPPPSDERAKKRRRRK